MKRRIIDELAFTYLQRNQKYGGSFYQSLHRHGDIAYVVQCEHKLNRIKTMTANEIVDNEESIRDSVLDFMNYTFMFVAFKGRTAPVGDKITLVQEYSIIDYMMSAKMVMFDNSFERFVEEILDEYFPDIVKHEPDRTNILSAFSKYVFQ